ncbi:hypothetical protein OG948_59510 (plasmid) [Embleya sp. NBC_00888]|uniref:hypothetical protein n=1 Tax=Embleya sp. NBC_00888 TaxID=2975960 RepID=UPI002F90E40E|nr:hypothetical protein OG948_59510 [Embleya sp. NBC_00888]
MTAYEPGDAEEVVTRGVHTHTRDEAVGQTRAFDALHLLRPDVKLAHLELLPGATPSSRVRVRWTVPGAPLARAGDVSELVCAQLGLMDAHAHTDTVGADENATARPHGAVTGHLSLLWNRELARTRDLWRPALTLSLVADADAVKVTDHGLWLIRLPPQTGYVPLGYNLAVYLTTAPVPADEVPQALSLYRQALAEGICGRLPKGGYCVCGRTPDEHIPTDEHVRHYGTIAAAHQDSPPPDRRGPEPDPAPAAPPAHRDATGATSTPTGKHTGTR